MLIKKGVWISIIGVIGLGLVFGLSGCNASTPAVTPPATLVTTPSVSTPTSSLPPSSTLQAPSELPKKTSIEVTVFDLEIRCPTSVPSPYSSARMTTAFEIKNLNDAEIILESFEYEVYGNGYALGGKVKGEGNTNIPPYGTGSSWFPLPYISKDANPVLWSEMIKGNVTWTFKGTAHIRIDTKSIDIPFECIVKDYFLDISEKCL